MKNNNNEVMLEEVLHKHVSKEHIDTLGENVWTDILDAMQEYANKQGKGKFISELPTDADLETRFPTSYPKEQMTVVGTLSSNMYRQQGAKWLIEKLKDSSV